MIRDRHSARRLVRSYVDAVIADARASASWRAWDDDLAVLGRIGADRDFSAALADRAEQPGGVEDLLAGICGERGIALTQVLSGSGHLELLEGIRDRFQRRSSIEGPLDRVQITSAQPLPSAQVDELTSQLSREGREVVLQTRVDPGLIGGVVVRLGDWRYDFSIRSRLQALRRSIN